MRFAPLVFLLAACPASPPPGPMPPSNPDPTTSEPAPTTGSATDASADACTRDSECEIVSFAGCCACSHCVGDAKARSIASMEAEEKQCSLVRCRACEPDAPCPPNESTELFYAACQSGHCARMRK